MELITNDDWQWAGQDYKVAFATTSDPRVLAVIERENEYGGNHIGGDAYAPAFYIERGSVDEAGSTFTDDASRHIAERYAEARSRLVNWHYGRRGKYQLDYERIVRRWLRIFHATTIDSASSSIDRGTEVTIFNTPTWREHIGGVGPDPLREDCLAGDQESWKAALDGEVFGVGWASNVGRVMDDGETPNPLDVAWTLSTEVWGFLGEEYAKREAAGFEHGDPDLDPMLDFDEPGFVEHSDRMAESAS